MYRGKMLGGSSGLNLMAWGRASIPEYEAISSFAGGDSSWNFNGLLPFFKKSEDFSLIPANPYPNISLAQAAQTLLNLPKVDGFAGPIVVRKLSEVFCIATERVRRHHSIHSIWMLCIPS